MTRIIEALGLRCWPSERGERVGGEAAARLDRRVARLGLRDPGLRRRAHGGRQLGELGERAGDIGLRGLGSMRAMIARRSSPGDLVDRRMRTSLSALACSRSRKPPSRGGAAGGAAASAGTSAASSRAERGIARHAGRRERLERRERAGVGGERLDGRKLGGERLAALDRGAQRRGRDREPHRVVVAAGRRLQLARAWLCARAPRCGVERCRCPARAVAQRVAASRRCCGVDAPRHCRRATSMRVLGRAEPARRAPDRSTGARGARLRRFRSRASARRERRRPRLRIDASRARGRAASSRNCVSIAASRGRESPRRSLARRRRREQPDISSDQQHAGARPRRRRRPAATATRPAARRWPAAGGGCRGGSLGWRRRCAVGCGRGRTSARAAAPAAARVRRCGWSAAAARRCGGGSGSAARRRRSRQAAVAQLGGRLARLRSPVRSMVGAAAAGRAGAPAEPEDAFHSPCAAILDDSTVDWPRASDQSRAAHASSGLRRDPDLRGAGRPSGSATRADRQ